MRLAERQTFTKSVNCPSSTQLLWFNLKESPTRGAVEINSHLEVCDFCGAEAHFLSRHHTSDLAIASPEMPPHLRLLAESLLGSNGRTVDCEKSD